MIRTIAFAVLAILAVTSIIACDSSVEPTSRRARTNNPTVRPTPQPTIAPVQADFTIRDNDATLEMPDSISFHLRGRGQRPIEIIDIEFGADPLFSCASASYRSARTTFEGTSDVTVTWEWDMRRTGSIPPGSVVWWRWRVVDDLGHEFRSPRQEAVYHDNRFDWQMHTSDNITFYWYEGGRNFGTYLADSVRDSLGNLQLGRELTAPVKAFVYETPEDVRGAVLFSQEWTGGLAFVSHNILLITVNPTEFDSDLPGVIHELAHLLVNELTFNCFGDLPRWLDEGLAEYAEGEMPDYQRTILQEAIASDNLISIRSLNSSFPADHSSASLSYAQSRSLVDHLISEYGWGRMQRLLDVFAEGETHEKAIERVYRMNLDTLEEGWLRSLETGSR